MRLPPLALALLPILPGAALDAAPDTPDEADATAQPLVVWIGTGGGDAKGIYRAELDLRSGKVTEPKLAAEIGSAGFLALHPSGRTLYSLGRPAEGKRGVASFVISPDRKTLRFQSAQETGDGGAAHLAVDRQGRVLFSAQYGGGSTTSYPLDTEGKILPRASLIEHEGSGPTAKQKSPHAHWVGTDPANRFLFVPDLGLDRVLIYRFDRATGRLAPHGEGVCPPGAGPRHMKFHPTRPFAYVLNELALSITVFRYEADAGRLTPLQTISTLPEELRETFCSASEIRIDPSGRFVYAGNRGHDTIACFRLDEVTGRLTFVEREAIRGAWPRNFNVDPTGRWLLAAGGRSNTIAVFRIDGETGGLVFTGQAVNCPGPICLEFQSAP